MPGDEPIIYLNGGYVPASRASLRIDDRGALFADGVYEVIRYYAGRPLALQQHVDRMGRSLSGIHLAAPDVLSQMPGVSQDLIVRNALSDATVYWQVTRGAAARDLAIPDPVQPTVLAVPRAVPPLDPHAPVPTKTAILAEDQRWSNCWIKSLMLLPNVLATHQAQQSGCDTAILHRGGVVTEATNANIMIVLAGQLWTHPANQWILDGVTRRLVLEQARAAGIDVFEQTFSVEQLRTCEELMLTGTTAHVTAVTHVDGQPIGAGVPGPVTRRLHEALSQYVVKACLSV